MKVLLMKPRGFGFDFVSLFKQIALPDAARTALYTVEREQLATLRNQKMVLEYLDISNKDRWPLFIQAIQQILSEDEILLETGASPSTLHRWVKDGIAPREGTRKLIKRALLELIDDKINGRSVPDLGRTSEFHEPSV